MSKKILRFWLLGLSCAFVLAACGNSQDFAYNEKVSSEFLHQMNELDDAQKSLVHGDYEGLDPNSAVIKAKDIGHAIRNLKGYKEDVQSIEHSEKANQFADSLAAYYDKQIAYYEQLKTYVSEPDGEKRKVLLDGLNQSYAGLSEMPDQILAVQKAFFEKAGITAK